MKYDNEGTQAVSVTLHLEKRLMALVMFVVDGSMQQLQEQMTAGRFRSMLNLWDLWCPLGCCCLDPVKILHSAIALHTTVTKCHPRRSPPLYYWQRFRYCMIAQYGLIRTTLGKETKGASQR